MIVLLDNGQDLDQCAAELGCNVGQLLTPLTRYRLRDPSKPWAIDNGGFSGLDIPAFLSLIDRERERLDQCLFVALPDIVGSARRTLELFEHWNGKIPPCNRALVCQDGQEDLPMPWAEIAAVFIGGSTQWKCGPHALNIIKAAKAMGKWAHVGRVNEPGRFKHFEDAGADSCDGTGLARYTHMRQAIAGRNNQTDILEAIRAE